MARTIHGTDGGTATVTVAPVNIDQTPPTVTVTGAVNGAMVDAPGPALRADHPPGRAHRVLDRHRDQKIATTAPTFAEYDHISGDAAARVPPP